MVNRTASVAEASRKLQCYLTTTPAVEVSEEGHSATCRDRPWVRGAQSAGCHGSREGGNRNSGPHDAGGIPLPAHSASPGFPLYTLREDLSEKCGMQIFCLRDLPRIDSGRTGMEKTSPECGNPSLKQKETMHQKPSLPHQEPAGDAHSRGIRLKFSRNRAGRRTQGIH
ncbi:hypothetical protein D9M68_625600 [compost metagenome]